MLFTDYQIVKAKFKLDVKRIGELLFNYTASLKSQTNGNFLFSI